MKLSEGVFTVFPAQLQPLPPRDELPAATEEFGAPGPPDWGPAAGETPPEVRSLPPYCC